jgi:RHS repeat-associated protein
MNAYNLNVYSENPHVSCLPGKEKDDETGFTNFGARLLDPKTSRWLSVDPAMGEYIPQAPINDEARKYNQNLPGLGGIFNTVNANPYHYAGNNPIKYVDADGRDILLLNRSYGAGGHGHNAILVGNNKDGWILYSKDNFNVNTRSVYRTLAEFLSENRSTEKRHQYDRAIFLNTSEDQDKAMQNYGDEIYNRKYSFDEKIGKTGEIEQNCADLVADIIEQADSVYINKPKIRRSFFGGGLTINTRITWPNMQFENFKRYNTGTLELENSI